MCTHLIFVVIEIGDLSMNRRVLIGSTLASVVLSFGLPGCDGGGVEEGVPTEIPKESNIPLKPDMAAQTKQVKANDAAARKAGSTEKKN